MDETHYQEVSREELKRKLDQINSYANLIIGRCIMQQERAAIYGYAMEIKNIVESI